MNRHSLEEVARRSGLTVKACRELLDNGWMFIEGVDCEPRWEKLVA